MHAFYYLQGVPTSFDSTHLTIELWNLRTKLIGTSKLREIRDMMHVFYFRRENCYFGNVFIYEKLSKDSLILLCNLGLLDKRYVLEFLRSTNYEA